MEKVLDFLSKTKIFYVATVDGGQPRVRPFGAALDIGGKLSICTNNQKDVFKQMIANPKIEICTTDENGEYLRVAGTVADNTTVESKEKFFSAMPQLAKIYAGQEDHFRILSFETATATFQKMGAPKETTLLY